MQTSKLYTPKEVSALTGVSPPAIRSYTSRYARFFSPSATPDPGQSRQYTEADVKLTAFIAHSTKERALTHEQIEQELSIGALEQFERPLLETTPPAAPEAAASESSAVSVPDTQLQAMQALLQAAQHREQELQAEITRLQQELNQAQHALAIYQGQRRSQWWTRLFGGREVR